MGLRQQLCEILSRFNLAVRSYWPDTDFCSWAPFLGLGDMALDEDHDTPLGHGQQLCEILSRSNLAVKCAGPDVDFGYVCTVTMTLEIWPCVKVMTHPWTTIVWYIIQIGQVVTKLWPGHDMKKTDRKGDSYIPPNFVCREYINNRPWTMARSTLLHQNNQQLQFVIYNSRLNNQISLRQYSTSDIILSQEVMGHRCGASLSSRLIWFPCCWKV